MEITSLFFRKHIARSQTAPSQSIRSQTPARSLRTWVLFLPAIVYLFTCLLCWRIQILQDQQISQSYLPGQPYAKYLYEQLELEELIGDRGEAENYYYQFARIRNLRAPYILIRYRKTEADRVEALLRSQPKSISGRVDYFYTEDYEYIKRFFQWPAIEQGYPERIDTSLVYTFNLSDFSHDRAWRRGLLILIGLGFFTLPFLYRKSESLLQTISPNPRHNVPEVQRRSPAPADPKPPVLPTNPKENGFGAFQRP